MSLRRIRPDSQEAKDFGWAPCTKCGLVPVQGPAASSGDLLRLSYACYSLHVDAQDGRPEIRLCSVCVYDLVHAQIWPQQ